MKNPTDSENLVIDKGLFDQLIQIEPSKHGKLEYRPCKVTLRDGKVFDRVYIVEANSFAELWGECTVESSVSIKEVSKIAESPFRIPAKLATKMYEAGESGMGYCVFTLVLRDGRRLPYITGNAVDFVDLPPSVVSEMIVDLLPHEGKETLRDKDGKWKNPPDPYTTNADYYWCLYTQPQNKSGDVV